MTDGSRNDAPEVQTEPEESKRHISSVEIALQFIRRLKSHTTPLRGLIAVVAVLFGVVTMLSIFDVGKTQISTNIRAGIVEIELAGQVRLNPLLYRDLYWTGDAELSLPDGQKIAVSHVEIEPDRAPFAGVPPITLSRIEVAEGNRLRISAEGTTDFHVMEISSAVSPTRIMVPPDTQVRIQRAGGMVELDEKTAWRNEEDFNQLITLSGHTGRVTIAGRQIQFRSYLAEVLPVRHLNFWQIKNEGTDAETQLSTIREGLLILEDLDGKRIDFWEGEPIRFKGVDGTLRSLTLANSSAHVQFDGTVDEITSGYLDESRSLMPSTLAWLVNIPTVKALLALAAVLIGISLPKWGRNEAG
ncbi:MAG: hypothetical protein KJP16_05240 [Gammaproteobacteria bacterium]|nr:hypothetical protein [Gammaproteobacteria bacterium]NNL50203.1 hypothetical protein [Woeseiaceae bacterium]